MSCLLSSRLFSCRVLVISPGVTSSPVMRSRLMSSLLVLCRVVQCHVTSCHVLSSLLVSRFSASGHVMSCLATADVSCLGTGPLMLFPWCHILCITSCRLFLCSVNDLSSNLVLCVAPFFPVVLCLAISSRVMSRLAALGPLMPPYPVSFVVSLALATHGTLRFVFDMPS